MQESLEYIYNLCLQICFNICIASTFQSPEKQDVMMMMMMKSCHDVTLPVEAWWVTVKNILFIPAVVSVNFLSKLCHLLMCQVNSMLLYHLPQLLWSTRKKKQRKKETMGYKPLLLYLFRQQTYLQAMYYDMTERRGKHMGSVLCLSSIISLRFHSIDVMGKEKGSFSSP